MYGLIGSFKAAAQAMPLIAVFGEHRETRPVGGHAL